MSIHFFPNQYINTNTPQSSKLWETLRVLSDLYLVRARREVEIANYIQVVLMTVALVTLSFVVLMLLPPAIYKVYQTRDSTLDVFLSVPVARVQEIASAKLDRMNQLGLTVADVTGIAAGQCVHSVRAMNALTLSMSPDASDVDGNPAAEAELALDPRITTGAGDAAAQRRPQRAKRVHHRRFKTSWRSTLVLTLKIFALFAVAAAYFVMTYVISHSYIELAVKRMPEGVMATRRINKMRVTSALLLGAITAPVLTGSFRPPSTASYLSDLKRELGDMTDLQFGLLYGSTKFALEGSIRRHPVRDQLQFGNACSFMHGHVQTVDAIDVSTTSCETIADGVFKHGLNAAFLHHIENMFNLMEPLDKLSSNDNMTRVQLLLRSDAFMKAQQFDRVYLRHALDIECRLYLDEHLSDNSSFLSMRAALLAGFLAVVFVSYGMVYSPLITSLDSDLKRVQALLVMVPGEFMQSAGVLKRLLASS